MNIKSANMNYYNISEGNTSLEKEPAVSPSRHVWNPNLYRLQQEAPRPKPVECTKCIPSQPSFYGSEYHGVLSHVEAAAIVTEEGSYLVRESCSNNGFYTLTFKFGEKLKHYKLFYDGQHYVKDTGKRFDTVHELVADGLVTLYFNEHAAPFLEVMERFDCYEKSPYMTLNKLKLRSVISRNSSRKYDVQSASADLVSCERECIEPTEPPEEEIVEYDKPHAFKVHTFKGLNWCEFCGNFLWGFTAQGVKCEDCGFSAHGKCSEKVPHDCCPDLKHLRGVFGIDLTTLVRAHRTARPFVVDKCIAEIERRGVDAEGLYRVSGFAEEIESLKMALDKDGENADTSPEAYENINVIAGTLKLYLRLLPIPLITFETHPALVAATQLRTLQEQIMGIKDALTLLPPAHFNTLKFLMEHLYRVMEHQNINKMTAHNLSTVFAPTLMPAPDLSKYGGLPGMTCEISALEIMISNQLAIFS